MGGALDDFFADELDDRAAPGCFRVVMGDPCLLAGVEDRGSDRLRDCLVHGVGRSDWREFSFAVFWSAWCGAIVGRSCLCRGVEARPKCGPESDRSARPRGLFGADDGCRDFGSVYGNRGCLGCHCFGWFHGGHRVGAADDGRDCAWEREVPTRRLARVHHVPDRRNLIDFRGRGCLVVSGGSREVISRVAYVPDSLFPGEPVVMGLQDQFRFADEGGAA